MIELHLCTYSFRKSKHPWIRTYEEYTTLSAVCHKGNIKCRSRYNINTREGNLYATFETADDYMLFRLTFADDLVKIRLPNWPVELK